MSLSTLRCQSSPQCAPTNPPYIGNISSEDDIPIPEVDFDDYVIDQAARKLAERCLEFYTDVKIFLKSQTTNKPQIPTNDCEFDIWEAIHNASYNQTRDSICDMFRNPALVNVATGPQETLKLYHNMARFFEEGARQNKECLDALYDVDKAGLQTLDVYGELLEHDEEALEESTVMEAKMLRVERRLTGALTTVFEHSIEECVRSLKLLQLDMACVEMWSEWAAQAVGRKKRERTRKGRGVVLRRGW